MATSEAFRRRLAGHLPHLDIAGTDYIIDWEGKKLIETNDTARTIDIALLGINEAGDEYRYFYNRDTRELVYADEVSALSAELSIISLPNDGYLDPVGLAREKMLHDTDFLLVYPYQEHMTASVSEIPRDLTISEGPRRAR